MEVKRKVAAARQVAGNQRRSSRLKSLDTWNYGRRKAHTELKSSKLASSNAAELPAMRV